MQRRLVDLDRKKEKIMEVVCGTGSDISRIFVYNQILRNASPKLKKLVDSIKGEKVLVISNISATVMTILIDYIYETFTTKPAVLPITDSNVYELLLAAKKLELEDAQSLCLEYLESMTIGLENCVTVFVSSLKSSLVDIGARSIQFLLSHLNQLLDKLQFLNLDFEHLLVILRGQNRAGETDSDLLCHAAISWLKHNVAERKNKVEPLLKEFTSKSHQKQLIQVLFEQEQEMAFNLVLSLYSGESDSENENSNNNNNDENREPALTTPSQQSNSKVIRKRSRTCTTGGTGKVLTKRLRSDSSEQQQPSSSSSPSSTMSKPVTSSLTLAEILALSKTKLGSTSPSSIATSTTTTTKANGTGCVYFICKQNSIKGAKIQTQLASFNITNGEVGLVNTSVPEPLGFTTNFSMVYSNGRIYIIGGKNIKTGTTSSIAHILNLRTGNWTKNSLLESRCDFQTAILKDWIYAIGGDHQKSITEKAAIVMNVVERLKVRKEGDDTEENEKRRWEYAEDYLNNARSEFASAVLRNKIYAIGGYRKDEDGNVDDSGHCEVFDPDLPEDNQWKKLNGVLNKRREGLVAVSTGKNIYALGGTLEMKREKLFNVVEIYDPQVDEWTLGPSMIKKRAFASAFFYNNEIYVIGGDSFENPTMEVLNLKTNQWTLHHMLLPKDGIYSSVAFSN